MKRIILISLIVTLIIQSGVRTIIITCFEMNREYIALHLCENKQTPAMNCKGKCYLNKKINKQEEQERKYPSVSKNMQEVVWCCSSYAVILISPLIKNSAHYTLWSVVEGESPVIDFFHPPC